MPSISSFLWATLTWHPLPRCCFTRTRSCFPICRSLYVSSLSMYIALPRSCFFFFIMPIFVSQLSSFTVYQLFLPIWVVRRSIIFSDLPNSDERKSSRVFLMLFDSAFRPLMIILFFILAFFMDSILRSRISTLRSSTGIFFGVESSLISSFFSRSWTIWPFMFSFSSRVWILISSSLWALVNSSLFFRSSSLISARFLSCFALAWASNYSCCWTV